MGSPAQGTAGGEGPQETAVGLGVPERMGVSQAGRWPLRSSQDRKNRALQRLWAGSGAGRAVSLGHGALAAGRVSGACVVDRGGGQDFKGTAKS